MTTLYTKLVDFASKDALATGNPLKQIVGAEHDDEYNAIQTAFTALGSSSGSANVGHIASGSGAVATTVQAKLRQLATSPEDKGAYADGSTNDASYFQLAIDTISANGRGVLVLTPGKTYYLNSQINLCDNLVIWGYGAKLKLGTGFAGINKPLFKNFSGTEFTAPGTRLASQNIAFLGLEIDGQDTGVNGTTVADANMHGVIICCGGWDANTGVDNLIVRDCNMYSFAGAGVMTWHSSNVTIADNKFLNFFANTSLSIGSCIDHHDLSNSVISGNKINHTAAGLSWHGMVVLDWTTGSSNVLMSGNVITNMNGGDGISCEGNTNNLTDGIITGNVIKTCVGQGIGVDKCVSVTVTDNVIDTVTGPGILFTGTEYVVITGNRITTSGLGGIQSASGVIRALIANNSITGITYSSASFRGHGIEVVDTGYAGTSQVQITGNTVKDTAGAGVYCVGVRGNVSGNNIYNAGTSASNGNTFRAGVVADKPSFVASNTITSISNTHYAVSCISSDMPSVNGNICGGTYLTAYYYINYRGTGIAHNLSLSIEDMRYDANTNVLLGRYNGVPAGYFYKGDTLYETLPASAGYIGQVVTTTPSTWKTFGLIS